MQFLPWSQNSTPDTDEDDPARRYYKLRLKRLQDRFNLPRDTWPEYSNILKTCHRFWLITHLIFLWKNKRLSKKDYTYISSLWNIGIIHELQKRGLAPEEAF